MTCRAETGPAAHRTPSGHHPRAQAVTPHLVRVAAAVLGTAILFVSSAHAQNDRDRGDDRRSLDIGVNGVGLSIGDSPRWTGLRINYRDSRLIEANGVNLTLWY